jgi:O-antigen ligase
MFLSTIAVIMSLSRGALLTVVILLLMMLLAERRRILLLAASVALLAVVVLLSPVDVFGRLATIGKGAGDASIAQRTQMLWGGLQMGWDSFPMGVGLGNIGTYSMDYVHSLQSGLVSHNAFVDTFAESGIIGILLFLGVFGTLLAQIRTERWQLSPDDFERNFSITIVAIFVFILLALAHGSYSHYPLFWFLLALISIRTDIFVSRPRTIVNGA